MIQQPNKDNTTKPPLNGKISASEKRLSEAKVFLHNKGVNINSLTEVLWLEALKIAAGVKV